MEENYTYPLDIDWSQTDMLKVMSMWDALEQAYEGSITTDVFLAAYNEFKTVIKSIGEERQLGREFEAVSGYSLYHGVKMAKELGTGKKLNLKKK